MASSARVCNIANGFPMKLSKIRRRVEQCLSTFVDDNGDTKRETEYYRDLSLAETVRARSEQARLREPLEYAELPGLRFDHPAARVEAMVAAMATRFAAECTQ